MSDDEKTCGTCAGYRSEFPTPPTNELLEEVRKTNALLEELTKAVKDIWRDMPDPE